MTGVPPLGGELEQILGYLDHYREELLRKTADLTKEQLFQAVPPTTMTLGGLVKHLALVEDSWFHRRFAGLGLPAPWAEVDWGADPDWEWRTAADDSVEDLFEQWRTSVARSRAAVEGRALDDVSAKPTRWGGHFNLRWMLLHLVEEYARHLGHADLLREAVDGQTG